MKMSQPKLTAANLKGVWAGVTLSWDENYGFDDESFRENLRRLCRARVHGIYTTGSTGEFYVLDIDEFKHVIDVLAEVAGPSGIPTQAGCCAADTRSVIQMLEYAHSKGINGAQITIPYWMELTDRELLRYFEDVSAACPDMPLVHYNIPRAKRFLTGKDYLRVLDAAPNLIGVKFTFAGSNFGQLQDALLLTPQLSYFIGESLMASTMMLGAKGCYSSLVCMNPDFMLDYYAQAESGQWKEAIATQERIVIFGREVSAYMDELGEGGIDPVADKACGVASGFIVGHQRTRPPYIGWSDESIRKFSRWLAGRYPELTWKES